MPPLYENLTARENLKVKAALLGLPDSRITEVLHTVRLADTGRKRAGQFSLGMKQRLGIALALLGHPKLLILDEPANGLDPVGIEELRALIRSFPAKGITVILSSHMLSEVQQTADHIGIIAGGVLGYEGKLNANENLEQLFMDVVKNILSSHMLSEVQQTADHIGIIAGGVLGYEGKLNANENLEQLFMDVVKNNRREGMA